MTTLIERMAKAMCHFHNPCWSMTSEIMDGQPDYKAGHEGDAAFITPAGHYRGQARAALEAMKPPTDEMCFAAQEFMESEAATSATNLGAAYITMIEAALNEEQGT